MNTLPFITSVLCAFTLIGCGSKAEISPSQNQALARVSPSTTAASQGGAMQQSLDQWLKEEWMPLSTFSSATDINATAPKLETLSSSDSDESLSLQRYVEKWNIYHKNKALMTPSTTKEALQ